LVLAEKILDEVSAFHTELGIPIESCSIRKITPGAHFIVLLTSAAPQHFKSSLVASW
jgi:hypothetical protein